MQIPDDALGGDLIWWRESRSCHTAVTFWGGDTDLYMLGPGAPREADLLFRLHDPSGKVYTTWTQRIAPGICVTVDSRDHPGLLKEGVLAIFPTVNPGETYASRKYRRFYSMVDWYSDDGDLVSLHSDHSVSTRTSPIEFTEVVFLETPELRNFLVLINGAEAQKSGSVELQIRNHQDGVRRAVYSPAMEPFSLHKLNLRELFPDLCEFCDGQHATLEGKFDCRNLFSRPYVMTEGKYLAGYHGGDRYQWNGIPRFLYKALGRGEVNPMVAMHSDALTTTVNLLNSHGDLEDDFWVDAKLYNESGTQVAHRKRWLLARRHALSRGDVADLLGDDQPFVGHIALSFTDEDKPVYPRRLQALLEYRSPVSTARVMAWSDIWNERATVRRLRDELARFFPMDAFYGENYLGPAELVYRCHYRVWYRPPISSYISITNCGISEDYRETVDYVIRLFNSRGEVTTCQGRLAPQATDFRSIDRYFPGVESFLGTMGVGLAVVESRADLAVMHLSHHRTSSVFSAEHFLASMNYHQGKQYRSCGL